MEDWDETKLEEVVNKKHAEADKAKPKTSIVSIGPDRLINSVDNCEYFLTHQF